MAFPGSNQNQKIDLVDFGDLRLFMFKDDNLYLIGVPENHKNFPIMSHYAQVASSGYPKCSINSRNVLEVEDSRYTFYVLLWHLHEMGIPVELLDVGGFIGDFSLFLANFARTANIRFHATCFDPSIAGTLIPFNIELNGLQEFVTFKDLAISSVDGPMKFSYRPGHLDSASIGHGGADFCEYLVHSQKISTYVRKNNLKPEGLFIKLDTEGFEPFIIEDLLPSVSSPPIIAFEMPPAAYRNNGIDAVGFLNQLTQWYFLYDVSHLPHASRVRPVAEHGVADFLETVSRRVSGYADVLLIPKNLPQVELLRTRLAKLEKGRVGLFNFVGTQFSGTD